MQLRQQHGYKCVRPTNILNFAGSLKSEQSEAIRIQFRLCNCNMATFNCQDSREALAIARFSRSALQLAVWHQSGKAHLPCRGDLFIAIKQLHLQLAFWEAGQGCMYGSITL